MTRPLVVFTDDSMRPEAEAMLRETCRVVKVPAYSSEEVMAEACADATAILARLGNVTRKVIDAAPNLRIISRHGAGVDSVDIPAATERGILVTNTGSANAGAVSEYTFALLLGLLRKVAEADAGMRQGNWTRNPLVGMELEGRTLGIVGIGAIGHRVARHAFGFGMNVLAYEYSAKTVTPPGVEMTTLADLCARSDIVTVHARPIPGMGPMVNAGAIAAMKQGSIFVNTARGDLVDEPSLIAALRSGRLAGAALDVFEEEPLPKDSPLRGMPNVILSPHVAGQTQEALIRVAEQAAEAILDDIGGRVPRFVYNPEAFAMRRKNS